MYRFFVSKLTFLGRAALHYTLMSGPSCAAIGCCWQSDCTRLFWACCCFFAPYSPQFVFRPGAASYGLHETVLTEALWDIHCTWKGWDHRGSAAPPQSWCPSHCWKTQDSSCSSLCSSRDTWENALLIHCVFCKLNILFLWSQKIWKQYNGKKKKT